MRRIAWLDCSKGLCIIFVVMLYAIDLVSPAGGNAGWLQAVEDFVRPFRMPDFFLLSGLLVASVIGRDWRTYLDRKVVHFGYFYVLWLTILVAFEAPRDVLREGWAGVALNYVQAFVHPYSLLWFVYMLPVFFVVTKALRGAPAALVWTCAAALQISQVDSGVKVLDKFADYYVYFYSGFVLAPLIVRLADAASANRRYAWACVALWALVNFHAVSSGSAAMPVVSLLLAFAGAGAVITVCALTSHLPASRPLAYCGEHSIVIYLAFLIPMEISRKLAAASGLVEDPGSLAAISTAGGVLGALALYWAVRGTRLRFLFERPERFALQGTGWRGAASRSTMASAARI